MRTQHTSRSVMVFAALVIAVSVTLIGLAYRSDLHAERQRIAGGSSLIHTPCGPIEYAEEGRGAAVLLVHGAGGGFDQLRRFSNILASEGFRALAVSRFGYLRTPVPTDASAAAQADAYACLLDALKVERAAILGISAGGPSTMQFALRHPGRATAMVLLVPLAYGPGQAAQRPLSSSTRFMLETLTGSDFLYWAAMKVAPALVTRTILGTPPEVVAASSASEKMRIHEVMRQILPLSERQQGLLNDGVVATTLQRYELERVSAPTLVISTPDDLYGTFESSRYTASQIRGARFVSYPSGGHMLVGHDDEVMAEVLGFLGVRRVPLASSAR